MPPSPSEPAEGPGEPRAREALELAARAEAHLAAERYDQAKEVAEQASALRARLDVTLPTLARVLEAKGDPIAALDIYGQALEAAPHVAAISRDMGRLALKLGKHVVAEQVLARHLQAEPAPAPEAIADLARAQIGQKAFERAHATLKAALEADPGHAILWRTLGDLLSSQGRQAQAIVFFEQSLVLDVSSAAALDGLAEALMLSGGDEQRALSASEAALGAATPEDLPWLTASHARRLLMAGRLAEGWEAFARWVWPGDAAALTVKLAAPKWTPEAAQEGRLLLIGEENIAEELLLARALPGLIAAGASPILAVQPNWEPLAQRSFPTLSMVRLAERVERDQRLLTAQLDSPHVHGGELVGAWAPLRALPAALLARPKDFEAARPYLKADAARVAHWRERLAGLGPGPKVGVVWRSPEAAARPWDSVPFAGLKFALEAPGVHLIGVQAQDLQGELNWIRENFDLAIHEPPQELKLWDLDDLAAFTLALDVTVGLPDTTSILAAACGAETWFLSPYRHWMRLGAPVYPWFPKARVLSADGPGDWDRALTELNAGLTALAAGSDEVSGHGPGRT